MPLLDTLRKEYYSSGFKPRTDAARSWFMKKIENRVITPSKLLKGEKNSNVNLLGSMFFFRYDAKYKDELPYWDKFPLVIPMEFYPDGFLGINFHYLDYQSRAILLDKFVAVSGNKYLNEHAKFRIHYGLVREASKYREVKPCIKRYLYDHVKSQFLRVEPSEWDVAIFLPVQQFVGADAKAVWNN